MGREVRMVPPDWQHPKDERGHFIPLLSGDFAQADAEWNEACAKWQEGLRRSWREDGEQWLPIDAENRHRRYTDYAGQRPSPYDYMPQWSPEQATHLMMYEDTSEGTPISPAFATPEELARWLADNKASAFGHMTATYEEWLATIRCGWAPSAVYTPASGLVSGVAAA